MQYNLVSLLGFMDKTTEFKRSKLIMVTGGQRSGKSVFAEQLALNLSERPVYLATAQVLDSEMKTRVEIHKQRRQDRWRNIESPLYLTEHSFADGDVVLLDCLTLWASNWFFESNECVEDALTEIKSQLRTLLATKATFVVVTNEVGLGGVSANSMQRRFMDMQGLLNQFVATLADDVYLIVSGIPVKIK